MRTTGKQLDPASPACVLCDSVIWVDVFFRGCAVCVPYLGFPFSRVCVVCVCVLPIELSFLPNELYISGKKWYIIYTPCIYVIY